MRKERIAAAEIEKSYRAGRKVSTEVWRLTQIEVFEPQPEMQWMVQWALTSDDRCLS
jgi:hypothetical protein